MLLAVGGHSMRGDTMNIEKKDLYPFDTVKRWLRGAVRSLTMWFNSISGTVILALPFAQDALPQLTLFLGPHFYKIAAGFIVVGNIILRAKTSRSLAEKGK